MNWPGLGARASARFSVAPSRWRERCALWMNLSFAMAVAGVSLFTDSARCAEAVLGFPSLSRGSGDMDPHGAVGPGGILAACNNGVVYHSRTGAVIWSVTPEANFFLPTACCDAKTLFDTASQRFFVIAQQNDANGNNLHVAVSRSANPASGTTNDWWRFRFPVGIFIDYPGIGIDAQALHVTYRNGLRWFRLDKSHLIAGTNNATTLTAEVLPSPTVYSQGVQAVTVIGSQSLGNVAYAVTMDTQTNVTLYAVTNVLGSSTILVTNIPAPRYDNPSGTLLQAPQLGTTQRLNNSVPVVMGNAFWRDGDLWFCNAVTSPNQPERSIIRYYRISTGGFPNGQATLAEWGDLDGGTNIWHMHPAIGGNTRGDVCLVYTQSSSNSRPTMYSAIRKGGQTAFETILVKASTTTITNGDRWADYSVVSPDPEDQTFWVSHLTITNQSTVVTWWANITRDDLFYVDKNAGGSEVGTRELPYHTVRTAHTAVTGAKTLVIKPANYPEPVLPLRLDKTVRLENPYPTGTARIGP